MGCIEGDRRRGRGAGAASEGNPTMVAASESSPDVSHVSLTDSGSEDGFVTDDDF